jgi:hypothetical protein
VRWRKAWTVPAGAALAWAAVNLLTPARFLHGPQDAAALVVRDSPRRILYCGRANGAFIFSIRALNVPPNALVIRGDKLAASVFPGAQFEKFAHDFGVTHVVIEHRALTRPWDALFERPSPSMTLVGEFPLASSDPLLMGTLRVYRFQNPSPNPENTLRLKLLSGADLEAQL